MAKRLFDGPQNSARRIPAILAQLSSVRVLARGAVETTRRLGILAVVLILLFTLKSNRGCA